MLSLFNDSIDLRIGQHTSFRFESADKIYLNKGSVYVDSAGANLNRFAVDTQFGIVEHTGTQYMVTSKPNEINIAVREGEVRYEGNAGTVLSHATNNTAELIRITRTGLDSRHVISKSGEQWQWVNKITPEFSTTGKSLMVILNWVARETGRQIDVSDEIRQLAEAESITGAMFLSTRNLDEFTEQVISISDGFVITELNSDIIRLTRPSEAPD